VRRAAQDRRGSLLVPTLNRAKLNFEQGQRHCSAQ
jgi:hypothetical protein